MVDWPSLVVRSILKQFVRKGWQNTTPKPEHVNISKVIEFIFSQHGFSCKNITIITFHMHAKH